MRVFGRSIRDVKRPVFGPRTRRQTPPYCSERGAESDLFMAEVELEVVEGITEHSSRVALKGPEGWNQVRETEEVLWSLGWSFVLLCDCQV